MMIFIAKKIANDNGMAFFYVPFLCKKIVDFMLIFFFLSHDYLESFQISLEIKEVFISETRLNDVFLQEKKWPK